MSKLYEQMKQYSQFKTKEEFNEYKALLYKVYIDHFNKTDKQVIDVLSQYAVNSKLESIGVACPLMETLAEKVQKSMRTVRRSVAKLEKLGILKRIFMKERCKRGGYSASLYVFQKDDRIADRMKTTACKEPEMSETTREKAEKRQKETLFFFEAPIKEQSCKLTYNELMDETYARNDIPKDFLQAVLPMTRSPKTINFAWSRVQLAHRKSGLSNYGIWLDKLIKETGIWEDMIRRTKSAVRAYKLEEIRKDFGALLYGTMYDLFLAIAGDFVASVRRNSGVVLYDWINE